MAHYVDTHPDFTDCFVLRSATTGEWQYVGGELAEQAAAKHSVFAPKPIPGDEDDLGEWEARDRFNCEDHHAHVQAGWEHHYTTAHIEPNNDIPF